MATDIQFVGYAQGCRVAGRLALDDARLADHMNRNDWIKLYDVTVVCLDDGTLRQLPELEVERGELNLVVADGPRGDPARRVRTRPEEVNVISGTFEARGFLHSPPSGDPIGSFDKRPPMIALTDASVAFHVADSPVHESFETVLINRDTTRSVQRLSPLGIR